MIYDLPCPFCDYQGPSPVLGRSDAVIIFEPLGPVTPGHVLVVSIEHVRDAADNPRITAVVMLAAAQYINEQQIGACNIITSIGEAATQTVKHLHLHIVPRYAGDGLKLPWSEERT